MCGIVGLFLKDESLVPRLGELLSDMLVSMSDRGPDSAGVAIYGGSSVDETKITLRSPEPDADFEGLARDLLSETRIEVPIQVKDSHAIISVPTAAADAISAALMRIRPNTSRTSIGKTIEIYKEVGLPSDVVQRFRLRRLSGSHGIGHTRMATESAVTTMGAHPFSTGPDQCLVHNGSLSNHNNLRRVLRHRGMLFETDNDSEVAASYLTAKIADGLSLHAALEASLNELDGFFTFVVGTATGFAVVRDPIACKPAVMAETDQYVAFGSEYRALVGLPEIATARVWEPEPAMVYSWER